MKPESENPPHAADAADAPVAPDSTDEAGKASKKGKAAKAAVPATEADADPVDAPVAPDELMPESHGRATAEALELLFDACERFNVNPSATIRPRELAGWRYYPADRLEQVPAAVVLVTAGGLKLKHFAGGVQQDPETEDRLRAIFRAYAVDPKTKERVPAPLPADLTLPAEAVLGQGSSQSHRHTRGYLRRPRA